MSFFRGRRLRSSASMRSLVRETRIHVERLVYPVFVVPGRGVQEPISTLPGLYRWSVDTLVRHLEEVALQGIQAIMIFGIPEQKNSEGSEAWSRDGTVQRAVAAVKRALPELVVMTDVCLCEYTDHGHCGIVSAGGRVCNDATLTSLARVAVSHAEAGADLVAPSDMMDGRVAAIRKELDEGGFVELPIMSYAAKFCSAFYGPFREAVGSAPQFGDRSDYQMDPGNGKEGLRELLADIEEGADILMVKPGLAYLDVLALARSRVLHPLAVYNVSGEYAMVKAGVASGVFLDERRVVLEIMTGFFRAGADIVLTYHAPEIARWSVTT